MSIGVRASLNLQFQLFDKLTKAGDFFEGWSNTRFMHIYATRQRQRWMTAGGSERNEWAALDGRYVYRKWQKFATYPGSGQKLLIATSRLLASVLPPSERRQEIGMKPDEFSKVPGRRRIQFGTRNPYAEFVNEKRNFTDWSPDSRLAFANDYKKYLMGAMKS